MILTVTPNPTIDRVLFVRDFAMQDLVRAEREAVSPSGKAIDVSAVLHAFGVDTLALGLNAGLSGGMLAALLDELGVPYRFRAGGGLHAYRRPHHRSERRTPVYHVAHTLFANAAHLDELLARTAAHLPRSWGLGLRRQPAARHAR